MVLQLQLRVAAEHLVVIKDLSSFSKESHSVNNATASVLPKLILSGPAAFPQRGGPEALRANARDRYLVVQLLHHVGDACAAGGKRERGRRKERGRGIPVLQEKPPLSVPASSLRHRNCENEHTYIRLYTLGGVKEAPRRVLRTELHGLPCARTSSSAGPLTPRPSHQPPGPSISMASTPAEKLSHSRFIHTW